MRTGQEPAVRGIKISALNDGEVHLPPMYYPGLDFGAHPEVCGNVLPFQDAVKRSASGRAVV
jgi:hypothetical protein